MTDTQRRLERVYPPKIMFSLVNPVMTWLLGTSLGKLFPDLARLEFKGHKTGKARVVVSALHDIDGRRAILTNSGWRHNFRNGHPLTAIIEGEEVEMTGTLESGADAVADVYLRRIKELGPDQAPRRLGISIPDGPPPTREELSALAEREGLSVVYLKERS